MQLRKVTRADVKNCQALPNSYERGNSENFAKSALATFAIVPCPPSSLPGQGHGTGRRTLPQDIPSGFVWSAGAKTMDSGGASAVVLSPLLCGLS